MNTLLSRIFFGLFTTSTIVLGLYFLEQHVEQIGYDRRELEYQVSEAVAQREAHAAEARQAEDLNGAINERTEKTNINLVAAAAARAERERVRDAFAQRARDLPEPSTDACTIDRTAYAELLISVGQAVDQLAEDAGRIAADADRHAADSLMYQHAWPK